MFVVFSRNFGDKFRQNAAYRRSLWELVLFVAAKLSIPICIYVTSPGQLSLRSIGTLRRYVNRWLKHFGLTPVPRFSARLPIFFSIVSSARNSFGLAPAKTFLIFGCVFAKNRCDQSLRPRSTCNQCRSLSKVVGP